MKGSTKLKRDVARVRSAQSAIFSNPPSLPSPEKPQSPNFALGFDQNFPNPFTESTTLRYSLPQFMRVRLALYDVLGREVEILVDAQQNAGVYTVEFDSGELPAGLYLARIELDHLRFTKRMIKTD